MLRKGALIALIFAVVAVGGAYQAFNRIEDAGALNRVAGRVRFAHTEVNITGAKFKVTSHDRAFLLDHLPTWFEYKDKWPDFDRVEQAVHRGAQIAVLYGNCRQVIETRTCKAYGIETANGQTIASVDRVMDAERSRFAIWVTVGTAALLAAISFFLAHMRATMPPRHT